MEIRHAWFNGRDYTASFSDGVTVQAAGYAGDTTDLWAIEVGSPARSGERFLPHNCAGLVERDPAEFQQYVDAAKSAWKTGTIYPPNHQFRD